MAETIEAVVDGGKASAGPPLGPALGPAGVNIGEVIAAINKETKDYAGMKVPVKIEIDRKKNFTISVGTPPASALILKEAGLEKGSGSSKSDFVGDLTIEQLVGIAKMKTDDVLGASVKARVKEIIGTCVSLGVTVEGTDPRKAIRQVAEGRFDDRLAA